VRSCEDWWLGQKVFELSQGLIHLWVHTNFSWCLSSLKKGSPRSPSFEMNLFKVAIHPVSFCTSLM
jgi:hypothetical protein